MTTEKITSTTTSETQYETVFRLAAMPLLEYDKVRTSEALRLGVRVSVLDEEVTSAREKLLPQNVNSKFSEISLWPEAIDANELLNEMEEMVSRYIICDPETVTATVLWCVFTWLIDHVEVAPLAVITAPEKRCGKTQLLNLMGKLVRNPLSASNISSSSLFRVIEMRNPTLLIDEADTFFKENDELRGIINSGHTRDSAHVLRNVGKDHQPHHFSTWGAKAIAGIKKLADTTMDRAIVLSLRRKLKHEHVQRLRYADTGIFNAIKSKLARFAYDNGKIIGQSRPVLPDALNDRAQDNWEPLLAIATSAGDAWYQKAKEAALKLSGTEQENSTVSVQLLYCIKDIFDSNKLERISTVSLIECLCEDKELPWNSYNYGDPITPHQLAKMLSDYGIRAKTLRINHKTPRGYERDSFEDAFERYLNSSGEVTQQ